MKKYFLPLITAAVLLSACGTPKEPLKTQVIKISDQAFAPALVTIKEGQEVRFENVGTKEHWPASAIHPTHEIYPQFDGKKGIKPGESWAFTFDKEGVWRFHDHLFPDMKGTVTVKKE